MNLIINKEKRILQFVFLIFFISIQIIKPTIFYNIDGSLREFGIGYKRKTIIPMWLVTIILAIMSYLIVIKLS